MIDASVWTQLLTTCLCFPPVQEFQEEIAPIKDDVTHMNQLASTFGPHDIQLSPSNLERIDDLNTRWRLLQVHTNAHTHTYSGVETLETACRCVHIVCVKRDWNTWLLETYVSSASLTTNPDSLVAVMCVSVYLWACVCVLLCVKGVIKTKSTRAHTNTMCWWSEAALGVLQSVSISPVAAMLEVGQWLLPGVTDGANQLPERRN